MSRDDFIRKLAESTWILRFSEENNAWICGCCYVLSPTPDILEAKRMSHSPWCIVTTARSFVEEEKQL